jgi:dihydroorotate dehydrogenase electron transfer subunit
MRLHAPAVARVARPGQFVQIRAAHGDGIDPLLARPISLCAADPATGEIGLLFKIVGRGTALLAEFQPGETARLLGPIGRGFTVPETASRIALVGGGVGMPPLYYLAATLHRTRPQVAVTLCYGGRTAADLLLLPAWEALGARLLLATDDGSRGHHGLVIDPFAAEITRFDYVAACGPRPMLRAVQQIALAKGIPGQLSLEARMACGVGACLGCVCGTIAGNKRICIDGPVFALDEVTFDA